MFSLVIPVYRNEPNIPALLDAVESLSETLGPAFEAVFVVDGSPDRCYPLLSQQLPTRPFRSQLLLLSRNFGSFAAIRAGLEHGVGDYFAVMAADLQEPPELVVRMFRRLAAGDVDVVVGQRVARDDPFASRLMSRVFWGAYRRFIVPEIPPGGVDVFGCTEHFRDQLLSLQEQRSSLVAQIFWLGYRREVLPYTRSRRVEGKSAWTLRKKIDYFTDSIFAFTDLPIRLLTNLGGFTAFAAGGFGLIVAISRLLGLIEVPGYSALIIAIVFFGALNCFAVGIVGSFAWRAYENTKGRPLRLVLKAHAYEQKKQLGVGT